MNIIFTDFLDNKKVLAKISFVRLGFVNEVFGLHLEFTSKETNTTYVHSIVHNTINNDFEFLDAGSTMELIQFMLRKVHGLELEDLLDVPVCVVLDKNDKVIQYTILEEFL